jgi:hypothetical protein
MNKISITHIVWMLDSAALIRLSNSSSDCSCCGTLIVIYGILDMDALVSVTKMELFSNLKKTVSRLSPVLTYSFSEMFSLMLMLSAVKDVTFQLISSGSSCKIALSSDYSCRFLGSSTMT